MQMKKESTQNIGLKGRGMIDADRQDIKITCVRARGSARHSALMSDPCGRVFKQLRVVDVTYWTCGSGLRLHQF